MGQFEILQPEQWAANPFSSIGKQWMLICAEHAGKINLMTASWGGVGILWAKPVVHTYIRPQRFTRGMVDATDSFTLLFLEEKYREQLHLCGSKSGRDIDKIAACGFTAAHEDSLPYVQEAQTVLLCKKLYHQDLEEACFIDTEQVGKHYPQKDFHRMYISEITKILHREG